MRAAVVDNETDSVINVIVVTSATFAVPNGTRLVGLSDDSPVGLGWTRANDEWVAPPQPDPLTTEPSLQEQVDALILDNLTTTAVMQQQIDDLILAMLG